MDIEMVPSCLMSVFYAVSQPVHENKAKTADLLVG
jgi:hypothetical protein